MQQDSNYIYLYDLPKNETTSTSIAKAFEEQSGVQLNQIPQIQRNPTRPFYSAIVQIKDAEQFNKASEAMKYFQIGDKWCRALKYDKQLLGSNRDKLKDNNVFIRRIPTDMSHQDLQARFEQFGQIKSLKVSLNSDHSSRGYGFICFQDEQSAVKAVEDTGQNENTIAMKFEPKQSRSLSSVINNVYVKNIPLSYSDDQVRKLFEPFGTIKSLCLRNTPDVKNYQFGFVCYEDATGQDKDYGPKCAQAAIDGLHGKQMEGDEGMKLYVRAAMKAKDRELEKTRETLKYKTSKKRCNLYVKNFPHNFTEDNLKSIFEKFGEVEKIKICKPERSNAPYAFVCFMTPDAASQAKQHLHNQTIEGKQLIINHYEIKEIRELKRDEMIDKQGFEKYIAQKSGGFHLNDLISHPHMTQILQQLIEIMQQNEAANQMQQQNFRGGHGNRGGYQNHRGNRQINQHQMGGGHQGPPQGMMQNNRMPQAPNQMQGAPMPGAPMPGGAQMPGQGMPGAPMQGQQMPQQPQTPEQRYLVAAQKILPSVNPKNPYMKEQVGKLIYEYVSMMVPQEMAPKVTGMLIEIPPEQIKQYLQNFQALRVKVQEAQGLIQQASMQTAQPQQQ